MLSIFRPFYGLRDVRVVLNGVDFARLVLAFPLDATPTSELGRNWYGLPLSASNTLLARSGRRRNVCAISSTCANSTPHVR